MQCTLGRMGYVDISIQTSKEACRVFNKPIKAATMLSVRGCSVAIWSFFNLTLIRASTGVN